LQNRELDSNKALALSSNASGNEQDLSASTLAHLLSFREVSCSCIWSVAFEIICMFDGSTTMAALPTWQKLIHAEVNQKC
jgi:hypothetical protein